MHELMYEEHSYLELITRISYFGIGEVFTLSMAWTSAPDLISSSATSMLLCPPAKSNGALPSCS